MSFTVETIVLGMLEENCYVFFEESSTQDKEKHNGKQSAVVVDPGDDEEYLISFIEERHLHIETILLTHAHFDHIGALNALYSKYKSKIYLNENDFELYYSINKQASFFNVPSFPVPKITGKSIETKRIPILSSYIDVLHTPGHTKGSVCYYSPESKILFTGDTLFNNSIGRTDLPFGDQNALYMSLKKLSTLPNDITIYPGHMGTSTIGEEKLNNPFLSINFLN